MTSFSEWLEKYPNHKYTDATIKRYIRALDKAGEWLNISLTANILDITDYQIFLQVQKDIKSVPDYEEVNRNHGHGDLSAALRLYGLYLQDVSKNTNTANDSDWGPPLSEYDPGITKERWLELLPELAGSVWGGVLAMFYTEKQGATCAEIAIKFGLTPSQIIGRCVQLAKRVHQETNCPLVEGGDGNTYWPILFFGRSVPSSDREKGKGVFSWKLRPELYDALTEFDILRFLPEKEGSVNVRPEFNLTTEEAVNYIKAYISSKGFSYSDNIIENLYLSLKSKPFVILAGTSGTGKTKLVELFAEAIGAEYSLVSVRPDWSDGSDLFGHHDLNGNFIEGPVCEAFDKAIAEPDRPVLLCLDEMNLARVEYYLSDFLSVIESRKKGDDGTIKTKPIAQYADGIPDNLYFVGTVNMDETTFPFSKKVLDRANTIEFNYVELLPDFDTADSEQEMLNVPNSFLKTEYLVLALDCADEKEFVTEVCGELQKINVILREANAHVGYRVRDEIVFYMLNNKKAGNLLTEDEAMDNEIMQKILPRIQGSSAAIRDMLVKLFKFCMGNQSGPDTDSGKAGKQMQGMADSAKYKESARKIGYMMTRYEDDGFTSYWL